MKNEKILAVVYPGCIFFEIALVLELLSSEFQVEVISPDGKPHEASNGLIIQPHKRFEEVSVENCRAIFVPGGDPGSLQHNSSIDRIINEARNSGALIAAICAGPFVLAKAGILKGKRIAHGYGPVQLEFLKDFFNDVNLTDERIIYDDHILTAKPDAHIDFAVEAASRLGVVSAQKVDSIKDYYRGLVKG